MEIKKNPMVNLERFKKIFLLVGMIISLAIVLALFEKTTTDTQKEAFAEEEKADLDAETAEVTVRKQPPPPPPPPPQQAVSDVINIVKDDAKIKDVFSFELPDENDEIDFIDMDFGTTDVGEEPDIPLVVAEQMPEFPGGEVALINYIAENVVYPEQAQENDIEGKIFVKFVVTKKGKVDKVEVVRGEDDLLKDAAVEVVEGLPDFTPGKQRGKPVSVWYTVPIEFKLN